MPKRSEDEDILRELELVEQSKEEVDETAETLRQAAEAMMKAARDKGNREVILGEVESALAKLRIVDFPDLAESPIVQKFLSTMGVNDLKPGEIRAKGTLAEREREWTWQDVSRLDRVKFIPAEDITITFNGLSLRLVADQECEVPRPFYDIYLERRKALKQADMNLQYLLGRSDTPPDPNWLTVEGAIVRAHSIQGRSLGRPSGHLGFGPISDNEGEEGAK